MKLAQNDGRVTTVSEAQSWAKTASLGQAAALECGNREAYREAKQVKEAYVELWLHLADGGSIH